MTSMKQSFRETTAVITEHPAFIYSIITLILINAVIVGLETIPSMYKEYGTWFLAVDRLLLTIFAIEIIMRMIAARPFRSFFKSSWNWFDFLIVASGILFAGAHFVTVLRVLRVLRILRTISVIPSLRRLVDALLLTIPSLGNIMFLMSIFFYIYAVLGTMLYRDIAPEHFGDIFLSLLTLFQVVTLESWASGVMRPIFAEAPWSWLYFVSFVLIGTFVIFNLFIGVIVSNVEKANEEEKNAAEDKKEKERHEDMRKLKDEVRELKELLLEERSSRHIR
ncbi:ion transporter [Alteribacillus sp. HJP-4]|uniref:ion transporter n=1 Tax=Alteribacillus sp. HJP-4 TaxID=2775394 RepID=UPI0035CCFB27